MHMIPVLTAKSGFEGFFISLAGGLFLLSFGLPLLLIWLLVAGAKFGKAISEYLMVINYDFGSTKYRLAGGKPLDIIDGTFGALEYEVGFRRYSVEALGNTDSPAYVVYNVRRPSYGAFYDQAYQRDNVCSKVLGILPPLFLTVLTLIFAFM